MNIQKGFSGASAVICPTCGGKYLHHDSVEIYDRDEDAANGLVVRVVSGQVSLSTVQFTTQEDNPSCRRGGIRVWLSCEGCPDRLSLVIVQHKGCTYIYWE